MNGNWAYCFVLNSSIGTKYHINNTNARPACGTRVDANSLEYSDSLNDDLCKKCKKLTLKNAGSGR